jgi:hypothetical protein
MVAAEDVDQGRNGCGGTPVGNIDFQGNTHGSVFSRREAR